MKKNSNRIVSFLVVVMTIISLGAVGVKASDTSGAIIKEFGNTTAISGLEYSTNGGFNSKRSLHITKSGELTTPTKLGLTKGASYNISFYIKGTLTSDNGMYMRTGWVSYENDQVKLKSDANGVFSIVAGTNLTLTDAGDGWYKAETKTPWTIGSGSIGFFNVQSWSSTGMGVVDFYIDNLSITDANGDEMIENGGFEEEIVESNTDIITELGNTTVIKGLSYSDEVGFGDSSSIHVKVSHTAETSVNIAKTANLGLEKGKDYNFSFYIKGLLTTSKGMYIRLGWDSTYKVNAAQIKSDANGVITASLGGDILRVEDAGDGWYKVSTATPWECTEEGIDFLKVISGSKTTDFYIDNFSMEEVKTLDIPRETIITELKNTEENNFLSYSNEESYNGTSSLHLQGNGEKIIAPLNSKFGIKSGENYKVSFYFKGTITTMYFRLGWSYAGGSVVINNNAVANGSGGEYTTITALDDGWYKFESNMTANADTELIRVKGNNDFYIDQLSIIDSNGNELIANGSFEAPEHQTTDFDIVNNGSGSYTVNVLVKNNSAGSDFTVQLILVTHKDGVMQNIKTSNTAVKVAQGETLRISQNITAAEGETLTAILLDNIVKMCPLKASLKVNVSMDEDAAERLSVCDKLVTTFYSDEGTTRGFAWTAADSDYTNMAIRYAQADEDIEKEKIITEASYTTYGGRLYYKADLANLEHGETYVYQVGDTQDDVWSELYTFTTEPENLTEFSFIGVTDAQSSEWNDGFEYYKMTLDEAIEDDSDAAFIVNLGDLVNLGYEQTEWDYYFKAVKGYSESIPHMAVVGNHETRGDAFTAGKHFSLHFNNPQNGADALGGLTADSVSHVCTKGVVNNIKGSVYSFDYGNTHFAVLNSGSDWSESDTLKILEVQAQWLREDLNASDKKWKIVMVHQGIYPAKTERFDTKEALLKVVDECGVDLVLQGHDHMVTRTYPMYDNKIMTTSNPASVTKGTGTIYTILGSAGPKRYAAVTEIPDYMAVLKATASTQPTYSLFDVNNDRISVVTKQMDGTVVDSFEIVE